MHCEVFHCDCGFRPRENARFLLKVIEKVFCAVLNFVGSISLSLLVGFKHCDAERFGGRTASAPFTLLYLYNGLRNVMEVEDPSELPFS